MKLQKFASVAGLGLLNFPPLRSNEPNLEKSFVKHLLSPSKFFCIVALLCGASFTATAQELVTNGGFEMSTAGVGNANFAPGWTNADTSNFSGIGNDPSFAANMTMQYAFLGTDQNFGSLTQNLATIAGTPYTLTFFLANDSGIPPSSFDVRLNGMSIAGFPQTNPPQTPAGGNNGYVQYTHNFIGDAGTVLEFRYMHEDDFFRLDQVSVAGPAGVPELSSTILLAFPTLAALLMLHFFRSRSAKGLASV